VIQKKSACGYIPATEVKVKRPILRLLNVGGWSSFHSSNIYSPLNHKWASDSSVPNSHSNMKRNVCFWSTI